MAKQFFLHFKLNIMLDFVINIDFIDIIGFPFIPQEEIYINKDGSIDIREPEYFDSMHLTVTEMQLLEKVNISGIGENLSGFIIELTSYPWSDRSKIDQIMKFMKEYFPDNLINWEGTLKYLEGYV